MTDRRECTPIDRVLAIMTEEGFDGMANAMAILINGAMMRPRRARKRPFENVPRCSIIGSGAVLRQSGGVRTGPC